MRPSSANTHLSHLELSQAVADLTRYIYQSHARFSISGGAASVLLRMQNRLPLRTTDDIDLVIQPTGTINAETMSAWLLQTFPTAFVAKMVYGVAVPALVFRRSNGSVKHIDIEIFDVRAWPNRPQYDLDNPDNDITPIIVSGVSVPVFSARWLLREKIITGFERRGSRKEFSDLDDACVLLEAVVPNGLDLTNYEEAVRHFWTARPDFRQSLELKVICPSVLGQPWTWKEDAGVYWRLANDELQYLDVNFQRHTFTWSSQDQAWYLTDSHRRRWFYSAEHGNVFLWT